MIIHTYQEFYKMYVKKHGSKDNKILLHCVAPRTGIKTNLSTLTHRSTRKLYLRRLAETSYAPVIEVRTKPCCPKIHNTRHSCLYQKREKMKPCFDNKKPYDSTEILIIK